MQPLKCFTINTYRFRSDHLRLTRLAVFLSMCFVLTSCNESVTEPSFNSASSLVLSEKAININTASAAELEGLPKIGKDLAIRIVEYRAKYGKFRRTGDLILVRGMSDKKFRQMMDL